MKFELLENILENEHIKEMQIALYLHLINRFGNIGICEYKTKSLNLDYIVNHKAWFDEQHKNAVDETDRYFKYQGYWCVTKYHYISFKMITDYCKKYKLDFDDINNYLMKYINIGTSFKQLGTV